MLIKVFGSFFSISFGIALFFLVVGPLALNPSNIAWLSGGFDPTQHYLGWVFFRNGPWTFPLGLNPNFGLAISSSIVYSDSIPLLALLFKPFSSWLPETFQYFGIWLLICFILQAWFAWLLMGLICNNRWLQALGMAILVCSPPMWYHLGFQVALSSHFLILAALYLLLKPRGANSNNWQWVLLICITALVHFYLLIMILAFWFCEQISLAIKTPKSDYQKYIIAGIATMMMLVVVMWQAGYFVLGNNGITTSNTYGIGRLNLLTPFNPLRWSYILPDIKSIENIYENFNFLGSGNILMLGFTVPILLKNWRQIITLMSQYWPLFFCTLFFLCFAISNQIFIGTWHITIPLPNSLLALASILRACGRFFWPVFYLLILFSLYLIIRFYSKKSAFLILTICFFLQLGDTSAGWLSQRKFLMQSAISQFPSPLQNPFWETAAKHYQNVERTLWPTQLIHRYYLGWMTFASYAATYHLATNSAYLARVNEEMIAKGSQNFSHRLQKGEYDPNTLYILEDEKVIPALLTLNSERDLLAKIDGVNVLAPNWYQCKDCQKISADKWLNLNTIFPTLGEEFYFSKNGAKKYLLEVSQGWSYPEDWGIWSDGETAKLFIALPPKKNPRILSLKLRAFTNQNHPNQIINIRVNNQQLKSIFLVRPDQNQIDIPISVNDLLKGSLDIEFHFQNPVKPADFGGGDDTRRLAIGLESAVFH